MLKDSLDIRCQNYEIAQELVQKYACLRDPKVEVHLAVMQAAAMLAVADAIKEGGRNGQDGTAK